MLGDATHSVNESVMSLRQSESPTVSAPMIGIGFLAILVGHCGLFFVLYRARVLHHSAFADSDALVFGAPFLLAAAAYFLLFRLPFSPPRSRGRIISIAVGGLFAALLSSVAALIVAFNTYGT